MTVKELIENLRCYDETDEVVTIQELIKQNGRYTVVYTPIQNLQEVMVGIGESAVGIVSGWAN